MALLDDPDQLTDSALDDGSTNLFVDPIGQTIKLVPGQGGLVAIDGVTEQAVFSKIVELWHTNDAGKNLASFPFPFENITDEFFELIDGWNWEDATTRQSIRNGGWLVRNTSGQVTEHWASFKGIGDIFGADQLYHAVTGAPVDFTFTGAPNQAVQVLSDPNGDGNYVDGFDYSAPSGAIVFNRKENQIFSSAGLADIGEANLLAPKSFSFAVGTANDQNIVETDANVAANAPYTGMSITYHSTAQARDIGGTNRDFGVIIDGNGGTKQEIYTYLQYQLRQISDIDADADVKTGALQSALALFDGTELVTQTVDNPDGGGGGVYIDNYLATQINDYQFTDNTGTVREFPFLSGFTIDANDIAQGDTTFKYFAYMTDPDGAANGNEWGTAGGIILQDNGNAPITGLLSGASSASFIIDYDGSAQGGRTPGTDINVTVIGIGITANGAKYVRGTGVIAKQSNNVVTLAPSTNRQYKT